LSKIPPNFQVQFILADQKKVLLLQPREEPDEYTWKEVKQYKKLFTEGVIKSQITEHRAMVNLTQLIKNV
jgi:hypothetical protein